MSKWSGNFVASTHLLAVMAVALVGTCSPAWAQTLEVAVQLRAPLSTVVYAPMQGDYRLEVIAPAELASGVALAAFAADADGGWWQKRLTDAIGAGRQSWDVVHGSSFAARGRLWPSGRLLTRHGVVLSSVSPSAARITLRFSPRPEPSGSVRASARLQDIQVSGARLATGGLWTLSCRPDPMPENPFADFALTMNVSRPDGESVAIDGYYREPMQVADGLAGITGKPAATGRFEVRFRPLRPGTYHPTLTGRWSDGATVTWSMPELVVTGEATDPYVRVDGSDGRYLAIGGRMWWPVGINLHNSYDLRSAQMLGTRPGSYHRATGYAELLDKMYRHRLDATEIWLSPWNLGLEWAKGWPGYDGCGRFNQVHAERLDSILAQAERQGIKVMLTLACHGMLSTQQDAQWVDNPWNRANGGPWGAPQDAWRVTDGRIAQECLYRYLIARYAHSPAVLGWKLVSEFDLAAGTEAAKWEWTRTTGALFRDRDVYRHLLVTHTSRDYRSMTPLLGRIDGVGFLGINAYTIPRGYPSTEGWDCTVEGLHRLLGDAITDPFASIVMHGRPVQVLEYGGSWDGGDPAVLDGMLAIAPASCFTMGYAGAPWMWWWEWVDQQDRWADIADGASFIRDIDVRGGRVVINQRGEMAASAIVAGNRAVVAVMMDSRNGHGEQTLTGQVGAFLARHRWRIEGHWQPRRVQNRATVRWSDNRLHIDVPDPQPVNILVVSLAARQ